MKRTVKRIIYNIIIFSLLAIGIIIVCYRFMHLGNVEYTDNAVVCQHITPVTTRVAGFIKEIRFEAHQRVKAGDTLVDPSTWSTAAKPTLSPTRWWQASA